MTKKKEEALPISYPKTIEGRHAQVRFYLGREVTIGIDRPIGYVHHKGEKTLVYPINYGFIPDVLGGDGEELDVYLLGVDTPLECFTGTVIGIVFRADDMEDKLVMAPTGTVYPAAEIAKAICFQEKYYQTSVLSLDGSRADVEKEVQIQS